MRVYRDFFSYRRGIYKHSAASRAEASGFHSVRLVGWGEEYTGYAPTKYWVRPHKIQCRITLINLFLLYFIFLYLILTDCSQLMGLMVGRKRLLQNSSRRK